MAAECRFCEIVTGEREAEVVLADGEVMAFLDRRPLIHGHVLVVPRDHIETLPDLPAELLEPVFGAARRIAAVMPEVLDAEGTFVALNNRVSQSVPHLHVHVVPRRRKDGLRGFFWPRHEYESDVHMRQVAASLRAALSR